MLVAGCADQRDLRQPLEHNRRSIAGALVPLVLCHNPPSRVSTRDDDKTIVYTVALLAAAGRRAEGSGDSPDEAVGRSSRLAEMSESVFFPHISRDLVLMIGMKSRFSLCPATGQDGTERLSVHE